MIVKKKDFIPKCLKVLERKLKEELPEEMFEYEMIDKAHQIICEHIRHIQDVI